MRKTARKHINRGSLLLLGLVAMFIVSMMVALVIGSTCNAIYANNKQTQKAAAFNAAESGAELGALWLKNQIVPPLNEYTKSGTITDGIYNPTYTYTVHLKSGAADFLKTYQITSVGTVFAGTDNAVTKSVVIILKQASFGKYAYFTNSETSSASGGEIWWMARDRIDGPVHSNNAGGPNDIPGYSNFNINYTGSTGPIFLDTVTGSGNTIDYQPYRPRNETDFRKIFKNGSLGYQLGVGKIPLPGSSETQKSVAWGSTSYPSSNGVYLKADSGGGIYIRGDAQMTLSLDGSGNQKFTIIQGTNTTTVILNKATGETTTTGPMGSGSPTSANSLPNGVIYCTGSITSLSGEVADNKVENGAITTRSAFTIATDTSASKDITITGDLVYHTKPDKTKPASDPVNLAAGTLGLVGQDIKIAASSTSPQHPNREIDAVCMAGNANVNGSFSVNSYDSYNTATLTVIGGIIQSNRGPVGTLSGGVLNHGYAKDYRYDPRLATNPPPYYPTTGQYERLSWRMVPD